MPHEIVQGVDAALVHSEQREEEIAAGQVAQPHRAGQQQEDAEHETGYGYPHVAHHRRADVKDRILAGGGEDPKWDGDQQRHDQRCTQQDERVGNPLLEQLGHRAVVDVGVAQVPVRQGVQVGRVLRVPRLVQPQVVHPPVDQLLVRAGILAGGEGRAWGEPREREERHGHEHQKEKADENPADDVERHGFILLLRPAT